MARGDKRERDRAKKQADLASREKGTKEGRPDQRNMNDSAALGAKVAAKQAAKKAQEETDKLAAEWGAGTAGAPKVLPKKKKAVKKGDGMDDLLSAGLSASKKKGK
uniref:Small EDRK-rich factor-like N-terminal domain-containing protein n=1 Tax=Attheya septentrionalis TaxID=420275 RepID=A0A7S2XTZ6_9STRA|mmetsp:Transcript_8943/g.16286  ORF Transcript_8943/g.16286 Transcript_8943/m.16286 type:complete len:106 (+) Transcript_8943:162-479(+)|eukprot:CAMPEP_0198295788 /NCGR_PEP_ID=MMETSP1449-20131203/29583_1 /TAXON_ID=420275 /ORGANISM="Attheya septentrionalis, Strain CCMP2084" /LENGTH=105 /DNA_ID=CAMNT_0043996193 /DNA_START=56 /DNA_END=373 /DNA_ORIENTATION=+